MLLNHHRFQPSSIHHLTEVVLGVFGGKVPHTFTMSYYGHFVHTFDVSALTISPPAFRIGWAMGTPTIRETAPNKPRTID
jgi:hypothetical protein